MRFQVQHVYPIAADRFFPDMFFDADYNETLYREGLGFDGFSVEAIEQGPDGGVQSRVAAVRPRLHMPGPIAKLLGDAFTYREVGRLQGAAWHSEIVPSRLADKVAIKTVMRVEPAGVGESRRIAEFDIEVRLFGVGKLMERFIEKTLRESYEKATAHSVRWLTARTSVRTGPGH